jgi:hypothetical protein
MTLLRPGVLLAALALSACGAAPDAPVAVAPAPAAPVVATAPVAPPAPMLTEAQVRTALDRIDAAARKHDADAFGALMTDDAKVMLMPLPSTGMPEEALDKAGYLAKLRKQYARNAGRQEDHKLVKLVVRTDGGQATARVTATGTSDLNGVPLAQVEDQFYTFELRGTEPMVVAFRSHDQGVLMGGAR